MYYGLELVQGLSLVEIKSGAPAHLQKIVHVAYYPAFALALFNYKANWLLWSFLL